jgi:hypothetical protein
MDATTIGVDLAKNVFELVVADSVGQIKAHHRLSRARFMSFVLCGVAAVPLSGFV